MATIITKNSSTASSVPLNTQLVQGELAVNVTDKRLFTQNASDVVVELGTNPSSLTLPNGTTNGVPYLNGSKVLTTGSALTFDGANLAVNGGTVTAGSNYGNAQLVYGGSYGAIQFRDNTTTQSDIVGDTSGFLYFDFLSSAIWRNSVSGTNELMRLTSTGLGIGTSSPTYKLDVRGDIAGGLNAKVGVRRSDGGFVSYLTNVGDTETRLASIGGGSYLTFYTEGTQKATIDSSGNLGLGVTPSAWYSFSKGAQFGQGGAIEARSNSNLMAFSSNQYINSAGNYTYLTTDYATRYYQISGQHIWQTAPSGTAGDAISFTQAMTLDASGNLLVATTSAQAKLTVSNGSNTNRALYIEGYPSGLPTSSFYRDNTDAQYVITVRHDNAVSSSTGYMIQFLNQGGTGVGSITSTGTTTAYNITSDRRLKENIADADSASALIDALQVRKYDWKADGSHQRYGFIAQELVTVAPEAVHQPEDPEEMMAVDYSKLVPMLVKELQSLRARVNAAETKLSSL